MPRPTSKEPLPTIRASEIGEYSYCARAWWYRHVVKVAPPGDGTSKRMQRGLEAHHHHGRSVTRASTLATLGVALALIGALLLLAALLVK